MALANWFLPLIPSRSTPANGLLILLAKKPFRHNDISWWVYLLDSSNLPDSGTRTLVFFASASGERRAFSWDADVLDLDEISDDVLILRLGAATAF
jgi:hypothetical protein